MPIIIQQTIEKVFGEYLLAIEILNIIERLKNSARKSQLLTLIRV
jgi:hypothetical protein